MRCSLSPPRRAFTLLELMAAVGIAGVLGAIAVVATADTIIDARAKAEARVVIERLRDEHRGAREQRVGLKVTSAHHTVTYQHTKGPGCTLPIGDARVATYNAASLEIASPASGACFNHRGEPDLRSSSSTIITNSPGSTESNLGVTATTLIMSVKAAMTGATDYVVPLRIDRAGIADLQPRVVSDATASETVAVGVNEVVDPIRGEVDFEQPQLLPSPSGTLTTEPPAPTDPCEKFAPDNPPDNCITVQVN